MYSIFGGNVKDLRIWLAEGRFPDGWEPNNREALGHSIVVGFQTLPWRTSPHAERNAHSKRKSPHWRSSLISTRSRNSVLGTRLTSNPMACNLRRSLLGKRVIHAIHRSISRDQ